ncbi:CPBP family intramembrane metalloprotease [Thermomonas brevis]|uniref:CPBP family intramembrane metalloprotease n=1 Tax=Thermomonas brevis TaxID=215691 RepID=A0A7G9QPS7_9GAMM|nr:CPBP family intramembrane glutamic endopeptidase [Thermomonas brevis]QNN45352.1 CPBP family intramembrane metalloprotease [Thermomonas brevis]
MRFIDLFSCIAVSMIVVGTAASYIARLFPIDKTISTNGRLVIVYCAMFLFARHVARAAGVSFKAISGAGLNAASILVAAICAALLLMFSYGENFIEVYLAAQHYPDFAHEYWGFHVAPYDLHETFFGFVTIGFAQLIAAPVVEEYLFRGLFLREMTARWGAMRAVIANSLLFAAFHMQKPYFLSTLVFGIVLCVLYIRYRSIWVNALTHAIFNASAFILQYIFNFHWMKSTTDLRELSSWIPEIMMLLISTPALFFMIKNNFRQLNCGRA